MVESEFSSDPLKLVDRQSVQIIQPGQWNHFEGPDFKDAHIKIEGIDRFGDIEIHLAESQWMAHKHYLQSAYSNVVLHVFLFPAKTAITPKCLHSIYCHTSIMIWRLTSRKRRSYTQSRVNLKLIPIKLEGIQLISLENLKQKAEQRFQGKLKYMEARLQRYGFTEEYINACAK